MLNLKNLTLVYVFFACISYNLQWFYIAGSFAYVDLLLPFLLLATLLTKEVKLDFISYLLIGLAVLSCASSLFAVSSGAFDNFNIGYVLRSTYFVILYVVLLNSDVSAENIIKTIIGALFFSLLLCFYVWTTSPRYFAFTSMPMLHVLDSPTGIKVNRNESGLTASLLFAISFYAFVFNKFFNRPINLFILLISLSTVALAFSKGAWLLSLIAFLIISVYRFRITKILLISFILIFLILLIPLPDLSFVDAVITRFTGSAETNAYRLSYVLDSLMIGADNFILGIGPGNYQEYTMTNGYVVTIDPHNSYMQSFAELGLLGLLFVIFFYFSCLYQSFFNAQKDKLCIIIFVLIIMMAVDGLQSGLSLTMKILYILAALTMRRGLNVRQET
jgi:O-antigen ligase